MKRAAVVAAASLTLVALGAGLVAMGTSQPQTCSGVVSAITPSTVGAAKGEGSERGGSLSPANDCDVSAVAIPGGGAIGALAAAAMLGLLLFFIQKLQRPKGRRESSGPAGRSRVRSG
jgi:hypothetical protein